MVARAYHNNNKLEVITLGGSFAYSKKNGKPDMPLYSCG